jgi:hypothetical protein
MYPPNTLLIVDRLVQEPFLVEVHTVAALYTAPFAVIGGRWSGRQNVLCCRCLSLE